MADKIDTLPPAPGAEDADYIGADRSLLVRSGLILGPYENIGRLPWWLNRVARGGPVLAPGPRDLPLQYVDVRDLADWVLEPFSAEEERLLDERLEAAAAAVTAGLVDGIAAAMNRVNAAARAEAPSGAAGEGS